MSGRKAILYYCLYLVALAASMKVSTLSCATLPVDQTTEAIEHTQPTISEADAKSEAIEQAVAVE